MRPRVSLAKWTRNGTPPCPNMGLSKHGDPMSPHFCPHDQRNGAHRRSTPLCPNTGQVLVQGIPFNTPCRPARKLLLERGGGGGGGDGTEARQRTGGHSRRLGHRRSTASGALGRKPPSGRPSGPLPRGPIGGTSRSEDRTGASPSGRTAEHQCRRRAVSVTIDTFCWGVAHSCGHRAPAGHAVPCSAVPCAVHGAGVAQPQGLIVPQVVRPRQWMCDCGGYD